jgi:UMF1 family MFS transporter
MTSAQLQSHNDISQKEYQKRIWAWTMYDWANSAFVTTVLAAVLPVYFSQIAGATLPSPTIATAYWSTSLSISLLIVAVISPILGTISDIKRGKKKFLVFFVTVGIVSVALLVFVQTGDWLLAAVLVILGRIGFSGANVFYDALLPHVAKEEDRDKVSTRGYAMGYLGGGILLAVNVAMIQFLPGTWGPRLSFLSVAVWWALFSIPIFTRVPEPPSASLILQKGQNVLGMSFRRLVNTLKDISRYSQLFKFLIAFLIYNDGIGTIIGVAAIYGVELGFGAVELILALLLVQFVGIPFSLIFGRLPTRGDKRRPVYLAFILFNLVALPMVGFLGARYLPDNIVGASPEPYSSSASAVGEGVYLANSQAVTFSGNWEQTSVAGDEIGRETDLGLAASFHTGSAYELVFNGQRVEIVYSVGPDHGIWMVYLDGEPLMDEEGATVTIDAFNPTIRYGESVSFRAEEPGEHSLKLVNSDQRNPESSGNKISLTEIKVLPGERKSALLQIIGLIVALELAGILLAFLLGKPLFSGLAGRMDTKRSIMLALIVYMVIAVWGFYLDSVIEFWFLAWMVAVVQGGSQALSRSLYSAMSPASKSGEFFGLFGVMEKFSAVIGPLIFASAGVLLGSSRPAVLSLILFFILGGFLLSRVNVDEGKQVAQAEDKALFQPGESG